MTLGAHLLWDWRAVLEDQSGAVRCVICSTLVIAMTWLIASLASHKSAAIRHRIFCVGFAGMLMVPVAILVTSHWNPVISMSDPSGPVLARRSSDTAHSHSALALQPLSPIDNRSPRTWATEPPSQALNFEPIFERSHDLDVIPAGRFESAATPEATAVKSAGHWRIAFPSLPTILYFVWSIGVFILGIGLVLEYLWIRKAIRTGIPVTDDQSILLLGEAARTLGQSAWPQMLCSCLTPVPIAVGLFRPAIVLPSGFGKWTNDRLRVVLMHELTHLHRRDVAANLIARLASLLYWFNPLVWLAAQRMSLERELACDDHLVCVGESPESYANELVEIAGSFRRAPRFSQMATPMASQKSLKTRVQRLMNSNLDRSFVSSRTTSLSAIVSVLAVMALAAISPSFGLAQANQLTKIADPNDETATLSGDIPSDWFSQLKSMPNLRKLTIRDPQLENFRVTQLRDLKNLTQFSAEDFSIDSRLADIVAVNIAQLPQLKSVEFHRTGITGRGLQSLSQSPTVQLILEGEELLTNADFSHVGSMRSLSSLVLDSTPIDAEGVTALQGLSGLRRLVILRHPSGTSQRGCESRIKAIAGLANLEELELGDTGYHQLVALKTLKSLRLLTLRNGGAKDASRSLKQLTQLKRVEIDNCDIRDETFEEVKANLRGIGVEFADITQTNADLLAGGGTAPDEATRLARRALDNLDIGRHFPSFWIGWRQRWSKIPSMTAEPVRTVHRLKQALVADHERQPWGDTSTFAYAPGQFFRKVISTTDDVATWLQVTYGGADFAQSREGDVSKPPLYVIRNGVRAFEESLGHHFPRQMHLTHQHLWWGVPTHYSITSSSVSPEQIVYVELPEESLGGEACRVFQAPGRSERLWVSKSTGRLRGVLHYIHQGYFAPFYKQDAVTKLAGRKIESNDEYGKLSTGANALSKEALSQLSQAWAEHEFAHAYAGSLFLLEDYREIHTGRWFPFKVTTSGWLHNKENEGRYDFNSSECIVTEVALDRGDLEEYWTEFLPKAGEKIQDQRYGVAVDYQYNEQRTSADLEELVNQKMLEYARSAIEIEKFQGPFAKMVGKPAPLLPAEGWIGQRPELAGQRYLLHFWAAWCGPCKNDVPILNSIAKNQIVIGVHPGDTPIDKVGQSAKDSKMAYPTIVAAAGSDGVPGYPAKMYPYCVEVDEQGKIARHGFLEELFGAKSRESSSTGQTTKACGTVVAIDVTNGLAVISAGENDGLHEKQRLEIVQDGKRVARLRVISLYKDRCVGKVMDQTEQRMVKVGDNLVTHEAAPTR